MYWYMYTLWLTHLSSIITQIISLYFNSS